MIEIAFLTFDKLTDCDMSGRSIILFNNFFIYISLMLSPADFKFLGYRIMSKLCLNFL